MCHVYLWLLGIVVHLAARMLPCAPMMSRSCCPRLWNIRRATYCAASPQLALLICHAVDGLRSSTGLLSTEARWVRGSLDRRLTL